ncbi:MAG: trypsin-like peptidase domain-containing protein, partial [Acidimicrobiales bacterium]
ACRAKSAPAVPSAACALQQSYVKVVKAVRPSVVQVTDSTGLGSGIVYDNRGDIVTNDHVVGSAQTFSVQFVSGRVAKATLVGTFPPDDLTTILAHDRPGQTVKVSFLRPDGTKSSVAVKLGALPGGAK